MLRSSIFLKQVVAVTGLLLIGFLFGHLGGNLQVFLGPDALNAYAHHLRELGPLLWVARIGLIVIFVTHLGVALTLNWQNRRARPVGYEYHKYRYASWASRSMVLTGSAILFFLLYHLAHFTFEWVSIPEVAERIVNASPRHSLSEHGQLMTTVPGTYPPGEPVKDLHTVVVLSFRQVYIAGLYVVAQVFLALHLAHGASSMLRTFGLNFPRWQKAVGMVGPMIAALLLVGNVAIVLACLFGFVQPAVGG